VNVLAVTNMYPSPSEPAFGAFVKQEVESVRRKGVTVDVLFVNGRRSRLNYAWGFPRLWSRLAHGGYDLLHAHYVFSGLIARSQVRLPVVLSHRGLEVFTTWQAPLCRHTRRWFDELIVSSPEMHAKLGVEDAHVIPSGVDLERFRPRPVAEARGLLDLPRGKRLVAWVGEHGRPEKRFDLAEQAMEIVRAHDSDADLVLVSGKPHELVPAYMSACDVLLVTSDAEGSPNVVKEAMASNLPIVSTPVGDVPLVVGDTEGCYLSSQRPVEIAEKLELALAFGRRTNGRERIAARTVDATAEKIIAVYEKALRARR